jgi:hypothetical protein
VVQQLVKVGNGAAAADLYMLQWWPAASPFMVVSSSCQSCCEGKLMLMGDAAA